MRIVIEIEDGVQARATTVPTDVTIRLSPDSALHDSRSVMEADSSPDDEAHSAGSAPTADAAPDEPEAFSDTAVDAVDEVEALETIVGSALDAGAAPGADVAHGDASDVEIPEDSGALDAGSAPDSVEDEGSVTEASGIGDLDGVPATDAGAAPADLVDETAPATIEEADDLTAISGLGPRSEAALMAAGITTYAALAARGDEELRQILSDAGLAVSVESWAAQAQALR